MEGEKYQPTPEDIEQAPYSDFRDDVAEKIKGLRSEGKREEAVEALERHASRDSFKIAKIYHTLEKLTGKKFFVENTGVEFFIDEPKNSPSLVSLFSLKDGFNEYEEDFYQEALLTAMEQDEEQKEFVGHDYRGDKKLARDDFFQEFGGAKEKKLAADKLTQNLDKAEEIIHEKAVAGLVSKIQAATVWEKYKTQIPSLASQEKNIFDIHTGYYNIHGNLDKVEAQMIATGASEEEVKLALGYMWNSAIDRRHAYTRILYNLQRTEGAADSIPQEIQQAIDELVATADPEKSGIFLKSFLATYIGGYAMHKPEGLKSIVESKLLSVCDSDFLLNVAEKNAEPDIVEKIFTSNGDAVRYYAHPINGEGSVFRNFEDRTTQEKEALNKAFEQLCEQGTQEVARRRETEVMDKITHLLRTAAENGVVPDDWRQKIAKTLEFGAHLPSVWRQHVRAWRYESLGRVEATLNALERRDLGLSEAGFEQKINSTGSTEMYLDGELVAVVAAPVFSEKPSDGKIVCWLETSEIDRSSIAGSQFEFRVYLAQKGQKARQIYSKNYWANNSDLYVSAPTVDDGKINIVEIENGEKREMTLN